MHRICRTALRETLGWIGRVLDFGRISGGRFDIPAAARQGVGTQSSKRSGVASLSAPSKNWLSRFGKTA
jgi:hypothetical protein